MFIQCTKKLLEEIKREPAPSIEEDSLFSWHANLLRVQSRKTLILVNDKTRYLIVLYGLKKRDFTKIEILIEQAIRETLEEELIKTSIIEEYLSHQNKEMIFSKTKNRSMVAKLNHSCRKIPYFAALLNKNSIYQREMSVEANKYKDGGFDNYLVPKKEMYRELASLTGIPEIISCQAAQIKVTLLLENHAVWRRLVVPTRISFFKFHRILQIIFGWSNSHLHQFIVLDDKGPEVRIVPFEVSMVEEEIHPPALLEKETSLEEYISTPIVYMYDFGDGWEHYIEVEKIIDEYDRNDPVCLEGEGNTPPEDVGGEPGYEEFLAVLSNREHEDHEWMVDWGRKQGYKKFHLDVINRRL